MRRGSLVGPLLLILIGVVFLLRNIRPDLPLLEIFVNWWPAVLIAWGALRIVELVVSHSRQRPMPRSGVTGGEWALIILITVATMSIWSAKRWSHELPGRIRIGGVEVFGEAFDYPVSDQTVAAAPGGRLVIENARGNTRITGAEGAEVKVSARKSVRALDREAADRAAASAEVTVKREGDVVRVLHGRDAPDGARVSVDLEITAPRGSSIEFRGKYGDLEVKDIDGEVVCDSDNAGVRLESIGNRARIDLRRSDIIRALKVKGDIEIKGRGRDIEIEDAGGGVSIEGSYSGETIVRRVARAVRFESSRTEVRAGAVPGEMRLSLSQLAMTRVLGPLFIRAETKDIQLADVTDTLTLDIDRGDIEIRQPRTDFGRIIVKSGSGDVELALPPAARFSLAASTERGEVVNDFDPRLRVEQGVGQDERKASITGSTGPGPEIRVETRRGRAIIRKLTPAEISSILGRPPQAPPPPEPPRAVNQ